ncbi:WD40 repeat-like protein [Myriangium duriaei CBS 260.36]|uniref:WD40 repeat-like protein n=1 Tax=Myriangium duriaei CBS 260.36 TaxID=1168546 RepID=A0A9P4MK74_9PEZI|nr:WD40 repeat-like protein [Myriangium duriaei CBS 260.36]
MGLDVDLSKLTSAHGATYQSSADGADMMECLNGTRTDILYTIEGWTKDLHGKALFWLSGMAGTGKSTIARTVAGSLDKRNHLGASFFFKRGAGDRANSRMLFPTILAQLVAIIPEIGPLVAPILKGHPMICGENVREQFQWLLPQTVLDLAVKRSLVIVIDALDECDRTTDIGTILGLLAQSKLRYFVTSRHELPIQHGFRGIHVSLHQEFPLEKVTTMTIRQDIRTYLRYRFAKIQAGHNLTCSYTQLPDDWALDSIELVVDLALPLFIVATTVCRFVESQDPRTGLATVLKYWQQGTSLAGLDAVYITILDQAMRGPTFDQDPQKALHKLQELLGPLVLLADSMSPLGLSELLEIPIGELEQTLRRLQSILYIPSSPTLPIQLCHLSFRDFLLKKENNKFYVNPSQMHARLAEQCLKRLARSEALQEDICKQNRPGVRRVEVSWDLVTQVLPSEVAYACRYWIWHFVQSGHTLDDSSRVYKFLKQHFLHWLEALSWLGRLSIAVGYIIQLRSRVNPEKGSNLHAFLKDGWRFLLKWQSCIEVAPLQLYYSALLFTPTGTAIHEAFANRAIELFSLLPRIPSGWGAELQTLEGHKNRPMALAYSFDGTVLASAPLREPVRLWNTQTGETIQRLEGGDGKQAVVFSHNAKMVAAASPNGHIWIWSADSGEMIYVLKDFSAGLPVFAPNGEVCGSASHNGVSLQLLSAQTREEIKTISRDNTRIDLVAVSPNGKVLAFSKDKSVQVSNIHTGVILASIDKHDSKILAIIFSQNGELLATHDGHKLRLWDIQTGVCKSRLDVLRPTIDGISISLSVDSKIAATTHSSFVHLWDTSTGKQLQELPRHIGMASSAAFSPDGEVLATSSNAPAVQLWNIQSSSWKDDSHCHTSVVQAMSSSSDGKLVASISEDSILIWDVEIGQQSMALSTSIFKTRLWERGLTLSTDGQSMIAWSEAGTVVAYDFRAHEWTVVEPGGTDGTIEQVLLSPDGKLVAVSFHQGAVHVWDLTSVQKIRDMKGDGLKTLWFAFSPDSKLLALGCANYGTLQVLNILEDSEATEVQKHPSCGIYVMVFSPDGAKLASGSKDGAIQLWNVHTKGRIYELRGHRQWVMALAFSSNREVLASSGWDDTIRLWNTRTGTAIFSIETSGYATRLDFNPRGDLLNTDIGSFQMNTDLQLRPLLLFINEWIQYRSQDLLWLPPEYRESCSVICGKTIVLGQRSGAVSFFRLNGRSEYLTSLNPT